MHSPAPATAHASSLTELALLFLRLGATAFGGPAAHIAMMHEEVVKKRGWLSEREFLDLLAATQLIPGPNSTELAIHLGLQRAGAAGLMVAGVAFIVPAMLLTAALGMLYVRYGQLPSGSALFYGMKPVIVAIVMHAVWQLAPTATRTRFLRSLAVAATVASALHLHELLTLGACALLAVGRFLRVGRAPGALFVVPALPAAPVVVSAAPSLSGIFGVFLKAGSLLYGSGYVLIAFLRADLVQRLHWLTEAQLVDAIAVGQVTPGPVFTTATFVGYVLAGPLGALLATVGIFLPAFVFVALSGRLIPRLRSSRFASAALDGINAGSLALMAVAGAQIARTAIVDVPSLTIGLISLAALVRYRVNATWLLAAGVATGFAARALGLAS